MADISKECECVKIDFEKVFTNEKRLEILEAKMMKVEKIIGTLS